MEKPRNMELGGYGLLRIANALVGMHGLDMTKAERQIAQVFVDAGYCRFYQDRFIYHPNYKPE